MDPPLVGGAAGLVGLGLVCEVEPGPGPFVVFLGRPLGLGEASVGIGGFVFLGRPLGLGKGEASVDWGPPLSSFGT